MTQSRRADDVRPALRLMRWLFYGALVVVALLVVTLGAGLFMAFFYGGSASGSAGTDVHGPLRAGATVHDTTEAGAQVTATIRAVTFGNGPEVVVSITGSEPVSTALDRWTLYLSDDSQLRMTGQSLGGDQYRFAFDGAIPAGKSVRFVHFDPDDSHGDVYFDVQ